MKPKNIADCALYLIAPASVRGTPLNRLLPPLIEAGVDAVQLRDKNLEAGPLAAVGMEVAEVCNQLGAIFIVNDRIDLAAACSADGVHLGQDDLGVEVARQILGDRAVVGLSTHSRHQVLDAQSSGADYIGVGPVFPTPTKSGRDAVGPDLVRFASEESGLPFFAIGGIDERTIDEVVESGALRVSVLRAVLDSDDPAGVVKRLRSRLGEVRT